jgi:hypothetical protein
LQFVCTYSCNYNSFFLLPHMMHSAAEAEAKQKAAEEENKKAAAGL